MRALILLLLAVPAAVAAESPVVAKTVYFGDVALVDGEWTLTDGGTHGVSGHTVTVHPDGSAVWDRRVDSLFPKGKVGNGSFAPTPAELKTLARWRKKLWKKAAAGTFKAFGYERAKAPPPPPNWVWAIVMRQGSEVRVVEGSEDLAEAKPALDWLRKRVDELSAATDRR